MSTRRPRVPGRRACAAILVLAAWGPPAAPGAEAAAPAARNAPRVPSTRAPHPSDPAVRFAGMTLEVRSGRVVVTEVAPGSPADRAGLRPLDVLLVINGRSLVDLDPISPGQALGLLQQERTRRTHIVVGRGAGTLSVDLPGGPAGTGTDARPAVPLKAGEEAPPFTGTDLQGSDFDLKSLRGRPVLIDFWASTCPPCERAAIPLRRIAEQHAGRLQIVGVSLDEDRRAFEAFAYNHRLPGTQIFDGGGWGGSIARLYGVPASGIPRYVLLDPDGRVAAVEDTLERLEPAIARLLRAEPAVSPPGAPGAPPTRTPERPSPPARAGRRGAATPA